MPRLPRSRASGRSLRMEPLEDRRLLAGDLELVRDINQAPTGSNPDNFVEVEGVLYFTADDRVHGVELWRTDGTEAGTYLLKDIQPGALGSSPANLTSFGGALYFSADDGVSGRELWRSDGTPAGTALVQDTRPGSLGAHPFALVELNATLFFIAEHDTAIGRQVWKTNGTDAGTMRVTSIPNSGGHLRTNVGQLTAADQTLYFTADDGVSGLEIWKSSGAVGSATRVSDIVAGTGSADLQNLTAVGATLYFTANDGVTGRELWKTDGTPAGTVQVADIRAGSFGGVVSPQGSDLVESGGVLYFVANDWVHGEELWKADENGASMVKDIQPQTSGNISGSGSYPSWLTDVGGTLYFSADGPGSNREIWTSDGTEVGTVVIDRGYLPPVRSGPTDLLEVAGRVYFWALDGIAGSELWTTDGTQEGTFLVADIRPGVAGSDPRPVANLGHVVFFTANDGVTGVELWKADGPLGGVELVKDIAIGSLDGSSIDWMTRVGGVLYFAANDGLNSRRLWRSDGTESGTMLVQAWPDALYTHSPSYLTEVDGTLYFRANGTEVWRSDGTQEGTYSLTAGIPGIQTLLVGSPSSSSREIVGVDGTIFFAAAEFFSGEELWKSDGTEAGTLIVYDTLPNTPGARPSGATPYGLTEHNGSLYYFARPNEMWISDGTEAGTVSLQAIPYGGAPAQNLTSVGGTLFFTASDFGSGEELWRFDPATGAAARVKDIMQGYLGSTPRNLIDIGGTLFFTAQDQFYGVELWKSDGTSEGTVRVKDIRTRFGSSDPRDLTNVGGVLYFSANDGAGGRELWKSDGTEAGTVRVKDIRPGAGDSLPANLTNVNGVLYFTANGDEHGTELWKSDGTEAGTAPVRLAGDLPLMNPTGIASAGGRLYVAGSRPEIGSELFALDLAPALPGDYDGSGVVDLLDLDVWKSNFGVTHGPGLAADGNIDGVVDAADYAVWRDHLGTMAPEPAAAVALGGSAEAPLAAVQPVNFFVVGASPSAAAPAPVAQSNSTLAQRDAGSLLHAVAVARATPVASPLGAAFLAGLDEAFATLASGQDPMLNPGMQRPELGVEIALALPRLGR